MCVLNSSGMICMLSASVHASPWESGTPWCPMSVEFTSAFTARQKCFCSTMEMQGSKYKHHVNKKIRSGRGRSGHSDAADQVSLATLLDHMDSVTSSNGYIWIGSEMILNCLLPAPSEFVAMICDPAYLKFAANSAHFKTHMLPDAKPKPTLNRVPTGCRPIYKNMVAFSDLRCSRVPMQTLPHDNVKGRESCPLRRNTRNTLATGGKDGIRLCNVQS